MVAALVGDAPAVAAEERGARQALRERRAHADDFGFEPQARGHAVRLDVVDEAREAHRAETVGGRLPFADHVPPAAVTVVVPAGVDAEDVGADLRRAFDERQFLVNRRVAPQRVHVIVVDDGEQRLVEDVGTALNRRMVAPQRTPVDRHLGDGALPVARAYHERDRHRDEIVAVAEHREPLVVAVFGPIRAHADAGVVLADLPCPCAVVLDLPHERERARRGVLAEAFDDARRLVFARRPCRRRAAREPRRRHARVDALVTVAQRRRTQRVAAPRVLQIPRGFARIDEGLRVIEACRGERERHVHRRDRLDRVLLVAVQDRICTHGAQARACLEDRDDVRPVSFGVALHDRKPIHRLRIRAAPHAFIHRRRNEERLDEPQFEPRRGRRELQAVVTTAINRRPQFHDRLRIRFAGDVRVSGAHATAGQSDKAHRGVHGCLEHHRHHAVTPYETSRCVRDHAARNACRSPKHPLHYATHRRFLSSPDASRRVRIIIAHDRLRAISCQRDLGGHERWTHREPPRTHDDVHPPSPVSILSLPLCTSACAVPCGEPLPSALCTHTSRVVQRRCALGRTMFRAATMHGTTASIY